MNDTLNKSNILVVEDSKTQAELLLYLLESSGYAVTVVHNGNDALKVIEKNPPAIIITDIVMPVMSGYELCSVIRNNDLYREIPVILLTSLDSPGDIISALECGADDFISKPYDTDYLISKLEKFLKRTRQIIEPMDMENSEEVFYSGKSYRIPVNKQKMLDLMISAYEATIQKNLELIKTKQALVDTNRELELTIADKDNALENVKIKEELLKQVNLELNIMNMLGEVINQSSTLEELLPAVAVKTINTGLSGTHYGIEVWLSNEEGTLVNSLEYPGTENSDSVNKKNENKFCYEDILKQEDPVIVKEQCDLESCSCSKKTSDGHGHILVKLMARERRIGVLNLITNAGSVPGEHVSKMLLSLGKQLGMAIENHALFSETKRLSLHDPLTGLANRRMIDITLETHMARANRYSDIFCLIILDIDFFKQYNDSFGHDEGDRILKELSSYLKENVRDTDLAARFGGEEFILIISEIGIKDIFKIAERHRELIHERIGITVSMGIAEYKNNQSAEDLIKAADQALYKAKENGRNRVELADVN